MKTVGDVQEWRQATAEQAEYDLLGRAPVGQVFVRYVALPESVPDQTSPDAELVCYYYDRRGVLMLCLGEDFRVPIPVSAAGPAQASFGAVEICSGVWALEPSLNMPEVFHAFVVVYDVPAGPPWTGQA